MGDLGEKHICGDCDTRYYDLGRPEATCPKCGSVNRVDEEVALASTLGRRPSKRRQPESDEADVDSAEDEEEEEEEEEEEDEDEDEDLLGDLEDDDEDEEEEDEEDED
jgi:uncharacterized protein (TIGR02300 family)